MFRNTLAQASQLVTSQIFSFLLAPIMIDRLGLTLFGVWTVVGAIVAYASVLDAGLTRALTRFVALHEARGEEHEIRECIGLGLIMFTLVGVVLFVLAWFTAPLAVDLIGHLSTGEMRAVLVASAVIFTVQGYNAVLQALPLGLRRMVPPNVAAVAGNVLNFAFSVAALLTSRSLGTYAWANVIAEAITLVLVLVSVRFVWRTSMAAWPSRERVRSVFGYSLQSQLGWIADLVNLQMGKIVVGVFVSVQAAGTFQLGSSVAGAIRSIGVITLSAMIPTATAEIVHEGRSAVRRLFTNYLPRTLSVAFPAFVLGALCAPLVLEVWIGKKTGDAAAVLIALSGAYAVNIVTGVPSSVSLADGRAGFVGRNALGAAGLNIVLTLALAPLLGLAGVVIGTVVAITSFSIVFVVRFARGYGLTRHDVREAVLAPALAAFVVALPLVPVVILIGTPHGRLPALALLAAVSAVYGAVYWLVASRLRLLPERLILTRVSRAPAR